MWLLFWGARWLGVCFREREGMPSAGKASWRRRCLARALRSSHKVGVTFSCPSLPGLPEITTGKGKVCCRSRVRGSRL